MSDFVQALVISGSIFAVMMWTQLGRREYSAHKVLIPVVSVAVFGYAYLRHAPTANVDLRLYAVGIAIGLVFGVLATLATSIERDTTTGKLMTRTGVAFLVTWLVAVAIRAGFVWSVENVDTVHNHVGVFMMSHQILETAVAPFFVLMALTTVVARVVAVRVRANRVVPLAAAAAYQDNTMASV